MTDADFRRMSLAFPEAVESSHQGHPDFRVGGKVFATLGYPDTDHAVVMLYPEEQRYFVKSHAGSFAPAKGAWGKNGSTMILLAAADPAVVEAALEAAWRKRAPKRLTKDLPAEPGGGAAAGDPP